MDFASYVKLITNSVAESGYETFMPSLCKVGDTIQMEVLAIDCSPEGDEEVAKQWASDILDPSCVTFLAYRLGNRIVEIIEISGYDVTNKQHLDVQPHIQ